MYASADSLELAEWKAFELLEPWGCAEEEYRFGMVVAMLANQNRDSSKRPEPYNAYDFFPIRDLEEIGDTDQRPDESWVVFKERMKLHAAMTGGVFEEPSCQQSED